MVNRMHGEELGDQENGSLLRMWERCAGFPVRGNSGGSCAGMCCSKSGFTPGHSVLPYWSQTKGTRPSFPYLNKGKKAFILFFAALFSHLCWPGLLQTSSLPENPQRSEMPQEMFWNVPQGCTGLSLPEFTRGPGSPFPSFVPERFLLGKSKIVRIN